jgi:hypothetical protein
MASAAYSVTVTSWKELPFQDLLTAAKIHWITEILGARLIIYFLRVMLFTGASRFMI